jgi:transposase
MNANLIFKWLKDERYAPDADAVPEESEPVFLPVEVEVATSPVPALATAPAGRIEIALPDGCRISAEGSFDGDELARLLKELAS